MKNNNFIEEEFEEICETIGHEILYTYDSLEMAEDSANTVKNMLKQFLEKAQQKQREELKKEIVEMMGSINFLEDITGKNNRELILNRYRLFKDKIKNI
jgi:2-oxo-4-hydroxy-4-carboxy--5-ureidoimidazoline (OHCU) decarboxylase